MTSTNEEYNPFEAPKSTELTELRLHDGQDLLVTKRYIVCREKVELPKICIKYGETDDMAPRRKVLRTLSFSAVLKIAVTATLGVMGLVGLSNSSSPAVASGVGLYLVMFLLAMGILIWKVAPNGYMAVDTTWYICGRYKRQIRRSRMIVGSVVFVGFTGLGVWLSWETNSLWPLSLLVCAAGASAGYEPEVPLRLKRQHNDVFLLQGHSKKFHQAWLRHVSDAE
ncbi:hypothetical protein [Fuerstiella marisgermanici]|uniref:Uncharacterized protein n=1 Tax=Fuerstiella marisgermanici TaxID=1891926 RepID=A0A1P8WGJ0_9PLAN|nr:hypothetical protein [Fuerstiella marisgermanici]APZ93164.1 hypothetical protein Fuma_02780 [Fuerstiella marisgermanici]